MADQKKPIDAAKVREQLQKIAGAAGSLADSLDGSALAGVSGGRIIDLPECVSNCFGKEKAAQ